jgi:hypothetical protein
MGKVYGAHQVYGIVAEFVTPEKLTAAAQRIAEEGYSRVEAYTPFAVDEVSEALDQKDRPVALITLAAGMLGGLAGFGMCWYAFAIYYPINVGGRPLNSWPAWIPITFELTVLFAALTAAIGMLAINGLPRLHHPIFETPGFERASRDRFFLCVEARDPKFDAGAVRELLAAQDPVRVTEVLE